MVNSVHMIVYLVVGLTVFGTRLSDEVSAK